MTSEPPDPNWARLLGLAAHELRGTASVGVGYLGFLTKFGATLTDQQRHFQAEAQKAWGKISAMANEMGELSSFEEGKLQIDRQQLDLRVLLKEAVAALPPLDERTIDVVLTTGAQPSRIQGDSVRLRSALTSILNGLRRELVTSTTLFVREQHRDYGGKPGTWVAIADGAHIEALGAATPDGLTTFDEWRSGSGLRLAVARRVLVAHGGAIWSPGGTKAGALLVLPRSQ
jgi:signal transduction histidine kinase